MKRTNDTLYVGNIVTFTQHGISRVGVIVKETIFPWCNGANSVTILGDDGGLYGHPTCCGTFKVVATGGDLEAARALWRAALMQYPVWRDRFAANPIYAPF